MNYDIINTHYYLGSNCYVFLLTKYLLKLQFILIFVYFDRKCSCSNDDEQNIKKKSKKHHKSHKSKKSHKN